MISSDNQRESSRSGTGSRHDPNILWIMTDQHRADCLGFMGHPAAQTPHLDRLADAGVVFQNAFCQTPVCMGSRASLLTGRYPGAVRVRGMGILPPSEATVAEILRRRGYRTGAFGKLHLTPEQYTQEQLQSTTPVLDWRRFAEVAGLSPVPDDPMKENYGFEAHVGCDDLLRGPYHDWLRNHAPELTEAKRPPSPPGAPGQVFVSPYPSEFHISTFIGQSAETFIRAQTGGQPWMTFCSFIAPHHPFEAPQDQLDRYDPASLPLPEFKGGVERKFIPPPSCEAIGEMRRYTEEGTRRLVQHYLAAISLIDDNVGRLIQALEETRQMENTLIVFTSDHGEFLGNHDLLRKPSLHYDETLRVPLMIRVPTGVSPRLEPGLVELVDVVPTVLGLAGVPVPAGVQGRDWSMALRGNGAIGRDDVYSDMFDGAPMKFGEAKGPYNAVQTLRTARWKLNLYPTAGPEFGQLFDLKNDPDESHNLYADPGHQSTRTELLWRLASRYHANTDPLPLRLTQY